MSNNVQCDIQHTADSLIEDNLTTQRLLLTILVEDSC